MPSILDYLDYRKWLSDELKSLKQTRPTLSQRAIQSRMGISSSGFLANVVSGRKGFTRGQAAKIAHILRFTPIESAYLDALVTFARARTVDERTESLEQLRALNPKRLAKRQLGFFARWYYVAIRELLNFYDFNGNYVALGRRLKPSISAAEAREAVAALEHMGLIQRNEHGQFELCDRSVSSGDEIRSAELAAFQITMMELAKDALDTVPANQRDISVLTVSIPEEAVREIKGEIQLFRKRLAAIAAKHRDPDRVYQMNFQMFPLSRTKES